MAGSETGYHEEKSNGYYPALGIMVFPCNPCAGESIKSSILQ